ncbi:hypothetical protein EVAR_79827_1 [Eumeta japonica]|uniref:Uncharacterized protein n=1 Tax=Eumeta variegata TaxID=151549 RepID=A0A4C1WRZ3_EUMVA|nr:hypothetical protein EVAR_79827_1 [Eumeta japonica]
MKATWLPVDVAFITALKTCAGQDPGHSLRDDRKSVYKAHVALSRKLTPGSGPLRTSRRGAATRTPLLDHHVSRVRVQITSQTPPAQAVEAARHRGHYGRAERVGTAAPALPDSEVSDRARATLRTAGRLPGHRGNNYWCEPMLVEGPDEGRAEGTPAR